jgi:2,4-dienoyl-CoA reductase-like NADH-dependent reductase (Old Yellow Enzyme family)
MSKLFESTLLGPYELGYRIVMAPLTRMRSDTGDIPGELKVEHYRQRASKGGFFGRAFLANPDLPVRFRQGLLLNSYNRATF